MQEFFMDYGLWLLVGLLVLIALVFLLSGRKKADAPEPVAPATTQPAPLVEPQPAPPVTAAPMAPPLPPLAASPIDGPTEPDVVAEPAPIVAEPATVSPAVTALPDEEDDLLRLKGVGPKLKALLVELGVTRYAQIAAWSESDIAAIDAKLGNFKGRPVRDQWVDQARYLAAGDVAGFEAKYGKI